MSIPVPHLTVGCIFEVDAATGNDGNAGGFDPTVSGGVDYTQGAGQKTIAFDGTTIKFTTGGSSATITIVGYTVLVGDAGNTFNVTGGTNVTSGLYVIDSVSTGSNTWTLHATVTTGATTDGAGVAGGALATPGQASGIVTNLSLGTYIKGNGNSYTISATANVSGGRISDPSGAGFWIGYATTRTQGNTDTSIPVLVPGANSLTAVTITSGMWVANIAVDNSSAAKTGITGFNFTNFNNLRNLQVNNGTSAGFVLNAQNWVENCSAINCHNSFANSSNINQYVQCSAIGEKAAVFAFASSSGRNTCTRCIVANTTVTGASGFSTEYNINCAVYGLTGTSAQAYSMAGGAVTLNCIAYGLTNTSAVGYLKAGGGAGQQQIVQCAAGNNTLASSATFSTATLIPSLITLTADPFTNGAGNDFSLNDAAGGGALLRALGWPTSFLGLSTTQNLDIGPDQHASSATGTTAYAF